MRDEYDFSKGERGKFYNPSAKRNLPIYLETDVWDYFERKAKARGMEIDDMLNDLLKKDIDLIESIK